MTAGEALPLVSEVSPTVAATRAPPGMAQTRRTRAMVVFSAVTAPFCFISRALTSTPPMVGVTTRV